VRNVALGRGGPTKGSMCDARLEHMLADKKTTPCPDPSGDFSILLRAD
jgi:hypothetical protein